jgi:hypothetical protein
MVVRSNGGVQFDRHAVIVPFERESDRVGVEALIAAKIWQP